MCECSICQQITEFYKYLETVPNDSKPYFLDLYDALIEASSDLEYYKSIIDGSWPNADEVIERFRKTKE